MALTLAFDGDDTLWPNEVRFLDVQDQVREILHRYVNTADFEAQLLATEKRNLEIFGYGEKGFVLSLIETAIDMTAGAISTADIQRMLQIGRGLFTSRISLFADVRETLADLAERYPLILITKGDLFEQESKIAQSGLDDLFERIHIVSEKTSAAYHDILRQRNLTAAEFLMVGNSMRSDIEPVLQLGGRAVLIPYEQTWAHETQAIPVVNTDTEGFRAIKQMRELPALLEEWL